MRPLLERLAAGGVLVADGAMGTMLMERGLRPGECPEALNLERPGLLRELASLYLDAGAELVQTNTFGGSPLKLAAYGLDARTEEVNAAAVAAAREAAAGRAYVAASVGPTGRLLRPAGDAEPGEFYDAFLRQMTALASAGVDAFCVETMTDLQEARLAVRAALEAGGGAVPVMASMTFDRAKRGFFTVMGVSVEAAALGLAEEGADVVGSNCGTGIEDMLAVARELRRATSLPLLIRANAGLPRLAAGRPSYPETPEFMAGKAAELLAAGVSVIGGCCGTTPAHVAALKRALKAPGPDDRAPSA